MKAFTLMSLALFGYSNLVYANSSRLQLLQDRKASIAAEYETIKGQHSVGVTSTLDVMKAELALKKAIFCAQAAEKHENIVSTAKSLYEFGSYSYSQYKEEDSKYDKHVSQCTDN